MMSIRDTQPSGANPLTTRRLDRSRLIVCVCLLLAGITLVCYWPVTTHQFICLDDHYHLFESPHISSGLTWAGVRWAFSTGYGCNWHPLTWISFMQDSQMYGMNARGFLLTNLLLHTANSVLLFLLLNAMTQRLWPSALVAGLFAWHPLHVESVAWASERKDVLSTFFFLLTLWAYERYVWRGSSLEIRGSKFDANSNKGNFKNSAPRSSHSALFKLLALLFFALGLMSKPMVVTLPFVLLLLDYWPLQRFDIFQFSSLRANLAPLVREKLAFFLLALAASVVTYAVQKSGGAVSSVADFSITRRIANASLAYAGYLSKTTWPVNLAAVYPMPLQLHVGQTIFSAVLLGVLTAFFAMSARLRPFVVMGWLWFLGTLVPVIGLVQAGAQAMADRYMYIPSIGLFILIVWGFASFLNAVLGKKFLSVGASVVAISACLVCTHIQLGYWRDSETLFRHAVAAIPDNYLGYDSLGKAFQDQGRKDEAISCWNKAVQLAPEYAEAQYNLGTMLLEQGKEEQAIPHLRAAVEAAPRNASAHQNLGNAYLKLGDLGQATVHYAESAALMPDVPIFRRVLGSVLLRQSRWSEAALVLADALRLEPTSAEANRNLGVALINQGRGAEALTCFSEAVRLQPDYDMRFNLGLALLDQHQAARAAEQFAECVRLSPNETKSHYRLAVALSQQHDLKGAIFHYHEALRLTPEFPDALNELARLLACAPEDGLRDGAEAVKLAEKACALTNNQQPTMLTTLAAAYAEAGRFQDAIVAAQKARALAASNGESALAAKAVELLGLCQSGRPLRE
jgi:tetratricopeptide (TPR) repeat protein